MFVLKLSGIQMYIFSLCFQEGSDRDCEEEIKQWNNNNYVSRQIDRKINRQIER